MSSRFPIGVATIYRPKLRLLIILSLTLIYSCTPLSNTNQKNNTETKTIKNESLKLSENYEDKKVLKEDKLTNKNINNKSYKNTPIKKEITLLLSNQSRKEISTQFIDILEMAIYDKNLNEITLEIFVYESKKELRNFILSKNNYGKIYIGPINNEDTKIVKEFCNNGPIFFSFSSNTELAKDCIYLVNFFPRNELEQLLYHLDSNSKVALLFPENEYGFLINKIIDEVINNTEAVIVNRASYKEDMSNVRTAIKELGKYELRKYELSRQIDILIKKNDAKSKKRLKKLQRFKTITDYDFTHLLVSDYGLRMLQVAPLLPYYDIDPDIITFMGTGVIDDEVFFYEPSLQGTIFPGIEKGKRIKLINRYDKIYEKKFIRISTLPYDVVGLLNYIYKKNLNLSEVFDTLNNSKIKFDGIDGKFYFKKNMIERDLDILEIKNGLAKKISN